MERHDERVGDRLRQASSCQFFDSFHLAKGKKIWVKSETRGAWFTYVYLFTICEAAANLQDISLGLRVLNLVSLYDILLDAK